MLIRITHSFNDLIVQRNVAFYPEIWKDKEADTLRNCCHYYDGGVAFVILWQSLKLFHYLEKLKDVFSFDVEVTDLWPENNKKKRFISLYFYEILPWYNYKL